MSDQVVNNTGALHRAVLSLFLLNRNLIDHFVVWEQQPRLECGQNERDGLGLQED